MAIAQSRTVCSTTSTYRDLASEATQHTWILVTYIVGTIVILYLLGLSASSNALFAAAEIPAVCVVTAVLRQDRRLRARIPLVWCLTSAFMWSVPSATMSDGKYSAWANEIAAWSLTLLIGYWLIRGARGSIAESKRQPNEPLTAVLANLSSIWGATLFVANLASLLIPSFLRSLIEPTDVGRMLVKSLAFSNKLSLRYWLPTGLLLLGLVLFASLRLNDDPYKSRSYKEILPFKLPPVFNELLAILRLPVWLVVVILQFLSHFGKHLWLSFKDFIDPWFGQMLLILCSVILPTALICLAHFIVLAATTEIAGYLSGSSVAIGLAERAILFAKVHAFVLLSMCLYLVAVVASAIEVARLPVSRIREVLKNFVLDSGFPAGNAVGRSFALFGILFIAVPVASTLPGSPRFGIFSAFYAAIMILTAPVAIYVAARSDRQLKALQLEVISLRLFESGLTDESASTKKYSSTFVDKELRCIYWELNLKHARPDRRVSLNLTAKWSDATGGILEKRDFRTDIVQGLTMSTLCEGLGSDLAGKFWMPGTYKLELRAGNTLTAQTQFEVTNFRSPATSNGSTVGHVSGSKATSSEFSAGAKTDRPSDQRYRATVRLLPVLTVFVILAFAGLFLVHLVEPSLPVWPRSAAFAWVGAAALILSIFVAVLLTVRKTSARVISLVVAFGIVLLGVAVRQRFKTYFLEVSDERWLSLQTNGGHARGREHLSLWVENVRVTEHQTILRLAAKTWGSSDASDLEAADGAYFTDDQGKRYDLTRDLGEYSFFKKSREIKPNEIYKYDVIFPLLDEKAAFVRLSHPQFEDITVTLSSNSHAKEEFAKPGSSPLFPQNSQAEQIGPGGSAVSPDPSTSYEPRAQASAEPAAAKVEFEIKTIPGDSEIFLDGTDRGESSADGTFEIRDLELGEHELIVRKSGHEEFRGSVFLELGKKTRFVAALKPVVRR